MSEQEAIVEPAAAVQANSNVNSEHGELGGDTHSSLNQSTHSFHENSDMDPNESSGAALSSRNSTRASADIDSSSIGGEINVIRQGYRSRLLNIDPDEPQKDETGAPILTKRFLCELFNKEWKRYYRVPALNDKLFLHYKGFAAIKNLEDFTELKCLYFEGNGCKSLKGLESNVKMKSLFVQENLIEKIEGLETLKELKQLNLSENNIKVVDGLKECESLETLYLKRNRLGLDPRGDIESLKGLTDRPTITCLDISDNYLQDPEILPEVLEKMPNLRVLYA